MGIFSSKPDYSKIRTKKHKAEEKPQAPWVKWVKFGVVTTLYLLFLLWVGSWWGLIVVPFIYDVYITKKIKWTWWKELESPVSRTLMSWVDAIVFALVAVYFVHNFFFQNYKIPSSSLEKTLLTGDYLLVSKLSYGPRIPQTPLTMPLTQHTMPVFNCKSYIEWPQWEYRRVKGFGKVEMGDIVVFNFPAGDTVAVNFPYDLYDHCYEMGLQILSSQGVMLPPSDSLNTEQQMQQYQYSHCTDGCNHPTCHRKSVQYSIERCTRLAEKSTKDTHLYQQDNTRVYHYYQSVDSTLSNHSTQRLRERRTIIALKYSASRELAYSGYYQTSGIADEYGIDTSMIAGFYLLSIHGLVSIARSQVDRIERLFPSPSAKHLGQYSEWEAKQHPRPVHLFCQHMANHRKILASVHPP